MKLIYSLLTVLLTTFCCLQGVSVSAQTEQKGFSSNMEKNMMLYPVPANTYLHVKLPPASKNEIGKVEIISLIGRKVAEQNVNAQENKEQITFVNLGELPQGIYVVVAKDKYGKIVHSSKLLVSR